MTADQNNQIFSGQKAHPAFWPFSANCSRTCIQALLNNSISSERMKFREPENACLTGIFTTNIMKRNSPKGCGQMKRALKIIIPLILVILLLAGSVWFFFVYRKDDTTAFFLNQAKRCVRNGNYSRAIQYYSQVDRLSPQNPEIPVAISDCYIAMGNFTRAEYTLVSAISENPADSELYATLSRVYVQQSKFMDAEQMLSRITNPEVAAEMEKRRPAPPAFSDPSGIYNSNLELGLIFDENVAAFWRRDGSYPCEGDRYRGPVALDAGDTSVIALTISPDGLVSHAVSASYTVGRIIAEAEFTDPVMESWARYILELDDSEPIMTDALWTIQALYLPEGIQSFEDLKYYEDLAILSVQNLSGVDFSPLLYLKNLKYLNLDGCSLQSSDLQTIGTLTSLTELHLSNCSISNIAALENLVNLQILDLSGNSIVSIDPVKNMTQMRSLLLSSNAISDISPIDQMEDLEVLDLNYNSFANGNVLARKRNLTELYLAGCSVENLNFLRYLHSLQKLNLSDNGLRDIEMISGCTQLSWLDIANNEITDLTPAASLTQLTELYADHNQLETLPLFDENGQLHRLTASYNMLEDIAGVCVLPQLNYLNVDYNNLRNIDDLALCVNLIEVHAFGNPIRDVQALLDCSILVHYDPTYALDHEGEEEDAENESSSSDS